MDYHSLEKTTVSRLRELAKEHDPVRRGLAGMKKQDLVDLVAAQMGISVPHKVIAGVDKAELKSQIRATKAERDAAIISRDRAKLKVARRQLHRLRRSLRKATVLAEV